MTECTHVPERSCFNPRKYLTEFPERLRDKLVGIHFVSLRFIIVVWAVCKVQGQDGPQFLRQDERC